MKVKVISLFLLFSCAMSPLFGQWDQCQYQREVVGVTDLWHGIKLPPETFQYLNQDLSDLRIYGINGVLDTLEAPYVVDISEEIIDDKEVSFKLINKSSNQDGFYFTFQLDKVQVINQIVLDLNEDDYDWKVTLQGSHDQQQWFTILENYRILGINNEWTDYKFNRLSFPDSEYQFFRLNIPSDEQPNFVKARVSQRTIIPGSYSNYPITSFAVNQEAKFKRTLVKFSISDPVPVGQLTLHIKDTVDYYRDISLEYLQDSVKTDHGWKYQYQGLVDGTLSSLDTKTFSFDSRIAQKFRLLIKNQDNQPLEITKIEMQGEEHQLFARFPDAESYYLTYGNDQANLPKYDIVRFIDNIPSDLTYLKLGNIQELRTSTAEGEPLFKNKTWLWAIMILIIGLLAWFSIKMIRN